MFDLSKIFDLSKKFAPPDTLLKSNNYCTQYVVSTFASKWEYPFKDHVRNKETHNAKRKKKLFFDRRQAWNRRRKGGVGVSSRLCNRMLPNVVAVAYFYREFHTHTNTHYGRNCKILSKNYDHLFTFLKNT